MTQEVGEFENRVTDFTGAKHCVSCGNGTDALMLGLWALGIGKGDEVITTPISFIASTGSIAHVGATPVYADVREDQNIDPGRNREEDHAAHQSDHAGALERPYRRHGRDPGHRAQA